ncbi:MAG: baseplate J/gp47 family protein [Myxococcota bacterium]
MSLQTPTTAEVADNILAQLEASLEQEFPLLPKSFVRVLAKVLAGVFILLYRYAGFIFLQMFVAHASMRETSINGRTVVPLIEWGRLVGVGEPEPATRAELVVEVTVEVQSGTLPAGSQLLFQDTGVLYLTTEAVDLDAPTVEVTIRASSDQDGGGGAGTIGNLEPGDVVSFANPLPNVARDAVVLSQAVTGADGESEDAYRSRVIRRFQRRPQGGAYADYQQWGEEDPGIIRVYPYTSDNPGEVDVYVEATEASSGDPDGIPTQAQLDAVEEIIDANEDGKPTRRPANAAVNVLPITRQTFDVTITGLHVPAESSATEAEVQEAIEEAIDEYLRAREPFIVGLSLLPRRDRITRSAVSGVADETASALGASLTDLALSIGGVSTPSYTLQEGEKAKLGTPTYQ